MFWGEGVGRWKPGIFQPSQRSMAGMSRMENRVDKKTVEATRLPPASYFCATR